MKRPIHKSYDRSNIVITANRPPLKHRKEEAALRELRANHSYLLCELSRKDARTTRIASGLRERKRLSVRPAGALKLVVPADLVLGRKVIAARKAKEKTGVDAEKQTMNYWLLRVIAFIVGNALILVSPCGPVVNVLGGGLVMSAPLWMPLLRARRERRERIPQATARSRR